MLTRKLTRTPYADPLSEMAAPSFEYVSLLIWLCAMGGARSLSGPSDLSVQRRAPPRAFAGPC
eukprot:7176213-Alexandrium_andersonii.AAC.1